MKLKYTLIACALAAFLAAPAAEAASASSPAGPVSGLFGKKKKAKAEESAAKPKPKKSAYDTFKKDVVLTAEGELMTLYRDKKNKLYAEFPKSLMGRRMLMGGTISSVSNPATIAVGYKYAEPECYEFNLQDSIVVVTIPQSGATTHDPQMEKAMSRNYLPQVVRRIPVKAMSKDSSSVVFEITPLVTKFQPKTSEVAVSSASGTNTTYYGDMKVFKDNASIMMYNNVDISRVVLILKAKVGEATVATNVSMVLLPEKKMTPRVQDYRVGIFSTSGVNGNPKYELSSAIDGLKPYRVANRWRLELADTAAWKAGGKVAVKNPIVWYYDSAFPEDWKEPIRKGVLAWNEAFEKFGLEGVMVAKEYPTKEEDPEFDPANIKYNCLSYVPNATANAMGPSWVDPETGEILNASVLVYNDVIRLVNNWRFVQTAQVDERARAKKLPKDVLDECMVYVISHEIGHTLGLMHNMGASASYPVESLRDPAFTAQYGTTPSIMDYARFNYVAQPEDKGVKLTPPSLGVYDIYAIEWLYKPVPDAKDMWEEAAIASKVLDAKTGDRMYKYGAQQVSQEYDPSARSEDLGDDPIKAGNYGVKNLKYILPNVNAWIEDDPDYSHRGQLYTQIVNQFYRYINHVLYQIGGVYINNYWMGAEQRTADAVTKDAQKKSLKWVVDQLKNSSWLNEKSITDHLSMRAPVTTLLASNVAKILSSTIPEHVVLSSLYAEEGQAYTLAEYYNDLYNELFASSVARKALSPEEKILQKEIVKAFVKPVSGIGVKNLAGVADEHDHEAEEDEFFSLCDDFCGHVALGEGTTPYQGKVAVASVDETLGQSSLFLAKVEALAKTMRTSGPAADRAHYEYLYKAAKAANEVK